MSVSIFFTNDEYKSIIAVSLNNCTITQLYLMCMSYNCWIAIMQGFCQVKKLVSYNTTRLLFILNHLLNQLNSSLQLVTRCHYLTTICSQWCLWLLIASMSSLVNNTTVNETVVFVNLVNNSCLIIVKGFLEKILMERTSFSKLWLARIFFVRHHYCLMWINHSVFRSDCLFAVNIEYIRERRNIKRLERFLTFF